MIINKTTGKTLAHKKRFLKNIFSQAFGLMWRKKLVDEGWIFLLPKKSEWHVTNLFVFQTITVVWLDEEQRVLQVSELSPFTFQKKGILGTKYLVELPPMSDNISIGDVLDWSKEK